MRATSGVDQLIHFIPLINYYCLPFLEWKLDITIDFLTFYGDGDGDGDNDDMMMSILYFNSIHLPFFIPLFHLFCGLSIMALSSSFACPAIIIPKIHCRRVMHKHGYNTRLSQRFGTKLYAHHMLGSQENHHWSFLRAMTPKLEKCIFSRNSSGVCHSCLSNSQIASSVFTLGTAAVLPFYTLMVAAPKAELTKKTMRSSLPYVGLGLLYAYLLCLSWTPDTIGLMFASKYWLPEVSLIGELLDYITSTLHCSSVRHFDTTRHIISDKSKIFPKNELGCMRYLTQNSLFPLEWCFASYGRFPAARYCENVLQRDNFSISVDSFVSGGSLCSKASLSGWSRE